MLHGNWTGVIRKLESFQSELNRELAKVTTQVAEFVESKATSHLKNQDLGWQPLSPAYLRWKLSHRGRGSRRLSEKILIATGTYFQSITSYIESPTSAFIGVKRGVAREADGSDVIDIASIHESREPRTRIPRRPLWEPTYNETKPEIVKMFRDKLHDIMHF
jgi:hypothetical protein